MNDHEAQAQAQTLAHLSRPLIAWLGSNYPGAELRLTQDGTALFLPVALVLSQTAAAECAQASALDMRRPHPTPYFGRGVRIPDAFDEEDDDDDVTFPKL